MALKSLLLACFIITATFCFDYSMNDREYAHALAYYNGEISSQFSQLFSLLDEQGKAALRKDQQEWRRLTNVNGFGHRRASVVEMLKQRAAYLTAWADLAKEQEAVAARNWQVETSAPPSTPPETQESLTEQQHQGQAPQASEPIPETPSSDLNTTATTENMITQQNGSASTGAFHADIARQSKAISLR
jgi:hypothetical protein